MSVKKRENVFSQFFPIFFFCPSEYNDNITTSFKSENRLAFGFSLLHLVESFIDLIEGKSGIN